MADAPPPTPSELLRMVTELQQANQRMAEANEHMRNENQRMQQQIEQLINARIEHGNNHNERNNDEEHRTHVSETPQDEEGGGPHDSEKRAETDKDELDNSTGPFTADIMNFQLPRQFTLPTTLTPYDGLGDPKQHIKKFRSIMIVNGASDPILCRCFPSFLDGPALDWFCSLPADSISRFQELAKQFEDHFAASAIYLHDSDYLTTVKQGPQESLKDYITRFTKIAMRIPDLHPEVHLHAIKSGLRPGKFQEAIAVAKPKTLAEFREKAKGQIDIEELRQARKSEKSATAKDNERPRENRKNFKPIPRYESYTQFNTKRDDIIKEILNSKLIKPPRKAGSYPEPKNVDKSKYCTFHQKFGHTTDECVIAKDLLERLARQGHLDKFIAGHMQKRSTPAAEPSSVTTTSKDKEKVPTQPRGVINCISGGYAGGGHTSSARKRTYRAMLALTDTINNPQLTQRAPEITFSPTDYHAHDTNLDDPVVISIQLGDLIVRKVLLDPGSSADVLFFTTFEKMKLSTNILQPSVGDLVGFSGERVPVMGSIWLQTTLGEQPASRTHDIQYLVVDSFSPYNLILGRPFLNRFAAIISTVHLCIKFPLQDDTVAIVHGDLQDARHCYNTSLKPIKRNSDRRVNSIGAEQPMLTDLDLRADLQDRPLPNEELIKLTLTDDPTKFTFIGTTMQGEEKDKLINFLRRNADLFAWTSEDMPGINPSVITHKLAINPAARPVAQKKRNLGAEKRLASMDEAKKLIDANFIREIRFTTWLANIVMVKKHNGKWRMCVDFTDLNKACPKDAYPLPSIDTLVDNSCGYGTLSFMDAYSGYNQIFMHPSDQEKTAFITEYGNYCYNVMPFGLKNAGATYQRLMNKVFDQQIGRNLEVYVDDMVAKTKIGESHVDDLTEIFRQIRVYNMRLNPEKCAFGVQGGKFLGFILTSRGIEANPEKCQAILDMSSPTNIKEVQRLTGRLAALSRFLPCLASKSASFFHCLRKNTAFHCNENCESAFQSLKRFLSKPPVLQKPKVGEPLYLYLSITDISVSAVLVAENNKTQQPVYFVSKSLQNAELRYPKLEKLAYALIFSARRLRPYFQSHTINVRTSQPLRQILARPELAGRLIKWSIELSEFDIHYQPRSSIKSQYLADFVAEFTGPTQNVSSEKWVLFVDGASNPQGAGAGILLENPEGVIFEHSLRFSFKASNNQAEYEALIAGLRLAIELQVTNLHVYCDSLLVVQQVNQHFQTKDPILLKYLEIVNKLITRFSKIEITHIERDQNHRADILSKLATSQSHNASLLQSTLQEPSINMIGNLQSEDSWQKPYIQYLKNAKFPPEVKDIKKFKRQASFFTLLNDELYRRGYSRPLLKCLDRSEAEIALAEVHEGICGIHSGARSLARKILRADFYWPTIWEDCQKKVRACEHCQRHAPVLSIPAEELHQSTVSWPFHKWGIDILGPFPTAPRQVKFLVVAIDYFSKWIEAQPLARITSVQMISFVWQHIICRFGIPQHIVTDNGRQFIDHNFQTFLQNLKVKQHFSSVEHPQSNGLAEAANKVLLQALRKKLDNAKGLWAELVPEILWGYNTSVHSTTKETPFRLVYGSEAMIPVEISQSSLRTQHEAHDEARRAELDLIEEVRAIATIRQKALQQRIAQRHNKTVRPRSFHQGDLVLRKTETARKPPSHSKLAATWDGPYRVRQVIGKGAYQLEELDGTTLPSTWNVTSLKKYYS
ncbi:uncharacterized protein LOC107468047 [Arachis duranensis]|uniref:Uncharacterized protein LOC107468047 n=1 Tax=Arachis duranensis TaxID=130453 RepID=A0A6P4BIG7_ARADU|nr:uncharacterized protein LOC107468047 [Arachis duranensis]